MSANDLPRFGIATPGTLWSVGLDERRAMAAELFDAGFAHIYMADHVSFQGGHGQDGFVQVAALSQLHEQLGVMIGVYLLPLRHPLPVARQLASMGTIAPGRLTFGVGIGGEDRHEVEVCGIDPRTRGKRANEALAILRPLLRGETVSFSGECFSVTDAIIKPTPPPIPIVVGGRSDAALARTARYGDGWLGVWCSPKRYAEALAQIDEQAALAGRGEVAWQHGLQPWVGIADTKAEARAAVAAQMEQFYKVPFEKFERYTPYGRPDEVAAELEPFREAGCGLFNLKFCTPNAADEISAGRALIEAFGR